MKSRIGWCDLTWNPVWGCKNHCPYCYARTIARLRRKQMYELELKRHYERHPTWAWTGDYLSGLKDFKPTFLYSQYCKKLPKRPQRIFVGSMSEIYYWNEDWIGMVIEKVKQYPQHTFQFLTKFHVIYNAWPFPENCWLGKTITREKDLGIPFLMVTGKHIKFLSIEPILEKIDPALFNRLNLDWIIIGAETGDRKGRIAPKPSWIHCIASYCAENNIPIYLKDSLEDIYAPTIKEFPKERK